MEGEGINGNCGPKRGGYGGGGEACLRVCVCELENRFVSRWHWQREEERERVTRDIPV